MTPCGIRSLLRNGGVRLYLPRAWVTGAGANVVDFLCCPGFAFFMSLRNQQPLFAKELVRPCSFHPASKSECEMRD